AVAVTAARAAEASAHALGGDCEPGGGAGLRNDDDAPVAATTGPADGAPEGDPCGHCAKSQHHLVEFARIKADGQQWEVVFAVENSIALPVPGLGIQEPFQVL